MFCPKCGNQLPEGAAFCQNCGANLGGGTAQPQVQAQPQPQVQAQAQPQVQPQAPVAAPKAPNPMIERVKAALKAFFSSNVTRGIGDAAKSTSHEWAILFGAFVLAFALSVPLFLKGAMPAGTSSIIPFGSFFGMSLLIGLISVAVISAGAFLQVRLFHGKTVSFVSALNAAAYASIPVTIAFVLNILLGLIWTPLAVIVLLCAVFMQVVLMYVGVQKLAKLEKSPFYGFSVVTFVASAIILGAAVLLYKQCIMSALSGMLSSALGGLFGGSGSLGDLSGLLG